ncbi:MAG: PEP-CTERM system histidine kinase PrsK [Syntrophaceae bacterium]|nr:PEP-CTERM system histidine kinase PrsK [Syntrophaceae bacterium]
MTYAAAVVTAGLAVYVVLRDAKNPVTRFFVIGIALLVLETVLSAAVLQSERAEGFLLWYQAKTIAASLLPGCWLLFSLAYGRANYRQILGRWRFVVIVLFVIPTVLAVFFWGNWFEGPPLLTQPSGGYLALGWAGYVWSLAIIAGAILIVMNLEQTLRHSTGRKRWQIKFMIIGVGALFGVRIYNSSLAILFNQVGTDNIALNAGVLLAADAFIAKSILRDRGMKVDIYLSHTFLYNSMTIILVGAYFIGVGLLAWLAQIWIGSQSLPLTAFLLFIAIMGLGSLMLSGSMRQKRKNLVSRLFERPLYDYREIWSRFTEATSSQSSVKDLGTAVVNMVSETLDCLSVTLWAADESRDALMFVASTALPEDRVRNMRMAGQEGTELMLALWDREMPVDFNDASEGWIPDFREGHVEALEEARIRYAVALRAENRLIGILTLSGRSKDSPLTAQDQELLKTIADQTASSLLRLRLAEQLNRAKALEALQMMSAFFVHDLKNLGSKLSLVMQNLPVHFENPEFRRDAIRSVTQSVEKINSLCSRLSLLSERSRIIPRASNLDQIVTDSIKSLDGMFQVPVHCALGNVTDLQIDGEQIQKVVGNLLLNANEAVAAGGEITVSTSMSDGWAQLTVRDTGCGMSREFIETRLFKPFQTTKPKGMGIGLFHCKTIVEAHGGRIEVESEEGKGSTFRVFLPGRR